MNKHMKNGSKIPPGNMEKARLGLSKAWLVRYPTDRGPPVNAAGRAGGSISGVCPRLSGSATQGLGNPETIY